MFDDVCDVQNDTIVGWNVCMGREEKMAAGMASSFRFAEVAGVIVCSEYHVAGVVSDDGTFLSCEVVEELQRV